MLKTFPGVHISGGTLLGNEHHYLDSASRILEDAGVLKACLAPLLSWIMTPGSTYDRFLYCLVFMTGSLGRSQKPGYDLAFLFKG